MAASAPGHPFVWKDTFALADRALYQAKADGRDRVAEHFAPDDGALLPAG